MTRVAAVDIGATSGRVMVADFDGSAVSLTEVSRFPNILLEKAGRLSWDADGLYGRVLDGLRLARGVRSWGIDTWAVDFGVVRDDALVGPVFSYRDPRHQSGLAKVDAVLPWPEHYRIAGIQRMPINTVYQIAADDPQRLVPGSTFLMVPDLMAWRATGEWGSEVTNASSTGMVDPRTRQWSPEVLQALGVPGSAFLPLEEPGSVRGATRAEGLAGLPLISVATHDTASAFVGTPLVDRDGGLVLSLGTWALIGAETVGVVPSKSSMELNATHELGIDGTVRILRNVCGMWLLEECRRAWPSTDLATLLAEAASAPSFAGALDIDAPELAAPGQDPRSIAARLDRPWNGTRGSLVRSILESLVARLMQRADEIEGLLGSPRHTLHVVGGACRIPVLMQWLADATGKRVVAGPVEATAMGNAIVQWRALGDVSSVSQARSIVSELPEIRSYEPLKSRGDWLSIAARMQG